MAQSYYGSTRDRNTSSTGEVDERAQFYDKQTTRNIKKSGGTPNVPADNRANISGFNTNYKPSSGSSSSSKKKDAPSERGGLSKREYERIYGVPAPSKKEDDGFDAIEAARREQTKLTNASFEQLLASLDSMYGGYENTAKTNFDEAKVKELQRLTSQQKAYGTLDSEQRAQSEERIGTQFANDFAKFIESLTNQRSTRTGEINSSWQQALAGIQEGKANDAYQQMVMKQQQDQQRFENDLAMATFNTNQNASRYNNVSTPALSTRAYQLNQQGLSDSEIERILWDEEFDLTPGGEGAQTLRAILTGQAPGQAPDLMKLDPWTTLYDKNTNTMVNPFGSKINQNVNTQSKEQEIQAWLDSL